MVDGYIVQFRSLLKWNGFGFLLVESLSVVVSCGLCLWLDMRLVSIFRQRKLLGQAMW